MARPRLTESARVSIALKVSQVDAARIDEVLTRPEFAGWTRAEWCREIIRTALRYYVGDAPAPDPGQARVPARPAAAQPVPPEPAPAPTSVPITSAPPAAPVRKLKLRCGNCKQVFSIEDTGERPLRRPCPYCARMGEIR